MHQAIEHGIANYIGRGDLERTAGTSERGSRIVSVRTRDVPGTLESEATGVVEAIRAREGDHDIGWGDHDIRNGVRQQNNRESPRSAEDAASAVGDTDVVRATVCGLTEVRDGQRTACSAGDVAAISHIVAALLPLIG